MNTKRMRLVAGVVSAIVLSAPLAMAVGPKLVFNNLGGRLQIEQDVPCGAVVNIATSVADGRMEMTPSPQGRDPLSAVLFDLTRLELFFAPFNVQHECFGLRANAEFREIGVRLASGVTFTGEPVGPPEDRQVPASRFRRRRS